MIDATKHEIRQYIKRERNKALPPAVDFWDFDCRFGRSVDTAAEVHCAQITALIDSTVDAGADSFYLEILAKPGRRQPKTETTPVAEKQKPRESDGDRGAGKDKKSGGGTGT